MPGRTWDSDTSYRRRLAMILPVVLLLLAALVFVSRRMTPAEIFNYVGWRGELELMPEITIIPDVPAPDAAPAQGGEVAEQTVLLDLADAPSEFEVNPPRIENERPERLAPAFDDFTDVPSVRTPARPEVSYSDKYIILKMVKPKYPPRELAEGIEGSVTLEILVNEQGLVEEANVIAALGPLSFQDAALEAAHRFEFQPPIDERGKPAPMWVKFLIKFRVYG